MIRDLLQRPFLHERSPDAPEVIVSTPLRFIRVSEPYVGWETPWYKAKRRSVLKPAKVLP